MNARSIALTSGLTLMLMACSIGKPVQQPTTYVVEPDAPTQRLSGVHGSEVVRMGNVRVAAAFAGNALVYRTDDVIFVSDPYQSFIADPRAMFGNQMASWLNLAGPFKVVTQPDSGLPADYILEATVIELYGDFRPGKPASAVMTVQFTLINNSDGTISLRAMANNMIVTADNAGASPLIANRTAIGAWEQFTLITDS